MITSTTANVWRSSVKGRRYFSRSSAIKAEVRGIIYKLYPIERSESDEFGRITYPGYDIQYEEPERYAKLYRRIKRLVERKFNRDSAIQSGNSGQEPAGLVAAVNRLLDSDGGRGRLSATQYGDAREEIERLLSAAPAVSDGWIPVSERLPEAGRWLALYGAPVFTHGPDAGKPWCKFNVGEGYLDKEDGKFYLLNWESPGQIGDSYNNLLAIATHWMYWELPDAPKVKP